MKNSGQISDQVGTSGVRFDTHTENELQNSSSVLFRQLVMFPSHGPVAMKEVHPQWYLIKKQLLPEGSFALGNNLTTSWMDRWQITERKTLWKWKTELGDIERCQGQARERECWTQPYLLDLPEVCIRHMPSLIPQRCVTIPYKKKNHATISPSYYHISCSLCTMFCMPPQKHGRLKKNHM